MKESSSKNILLVDGSQAVRQRLTLMLSMHKTLNLYEAGDGLDAVDKLIERDFDLVIIDIKMPLMDGLSLVRRVRGEISLKIPILIVSTLGKVTDKVQNPGLSADSYITKPVQAPDLINEVTSLLN